jgi:hypothetical protein
MAGLPRAIIQKYGVSKKAWSVYRASKGGRRHANPARRGRTSHRRSHARRRRNPTGYPFSGRHYRPNYRLRSGRYRDRPRAGNLPRIANARHRRRGYHSARRASTHRRSGRRSHRNPFEHSSFGRGSMGSIRSAIPLFRPKADFALMRANPIGSLVFGGASFFVGGVMGAAGGTLAILGEGFIVAVLIRYFTRRGAQKYAYIAPAWAAGAVVAALANILTSGGLTGSARLGDTMSNLQSLAAQVKAFGPVPSLQTWGLKGLTGHTSIRSLRLALPAGLRGLGVGADLRKLSPSTLTGLGDTSTQGWTYSP